MTRKTPKRVSFTDPVTCQFIPPAEYPDFSSEDPGEKDSPSAESEGADATDPDSTVSRGSFIYLGESDSCPISETRNRPVGNNGLGGSSDDGSTSSSSSEEEDVDHFRVTIERLGVDKPRRPSHESNSLGLATAAAAAAAAPPKPPRTILAPAPPPPVASTSETSTTTDVGPAGSV